MLTTRGIGGQSQCVPTGGYGAYLFGGTEDGGDLGGRGKFEVAPRRIYLRDKPPEPALTEENVFVSHETSDLAEQLADTTIEVDGDDYRVALGEMPTGKQAVAELSPQERKQKLAAIMREWNVPKREALMKLAARAEKELKESLVNDDEEFMIILVAADA